MSRSKTAGLLFILGAFFLSMPALAQTTYEDYDYNTTDYYDSSIERIEQFLTDITVNQDASIDVTESILYNFGDEYRHGIYRDIPTSYDYQSDDGQYTYSTDINLTVYNVTDENGVTYQYEESDGYYKSLKIGDPDTTITGAHWYVITYHAESIINGFDTHDELYWNVTGTGWDVPIDFADALITIPSGGDTDNQLATCYTGYFGADDSWCSGDAISQNQFYFSTTDGLSYYEGLTIVAGFDKSLINTPSIINVSSSPVYSEVYVPELDQSFQGLTPLSLRIPAGIYTIQIDKFKYKPYEELVAISEGEKVEIIGMLEKQPWAVFIEHYLPIITAIFLSALVILLWWKRGKEPAGRGTIIPQYEPPENLTPGEVGVIIDQTADLHDITASIIHLAVKGYLKIKQSDKKKLFKWGKQEYNYTFIKLKETTKTDSGVQEFERDIFEGIFSGSKKEVDLSDLQNKFYTKLPTIKRSLYKTVVGKNIFLKAPDKVIGFYVAMAIIFLLTTIGAAIFLGLWLESRWYFYALPVPGALSILFSPFMSKRTPRGAQINEQVEGFKLFLSVTEEERLKFHNAPEKYQEQFEEFLPYAVALEVEEEWAKQFEDIYKGSPEWYEGQNINSAILLTNAIKSMSTTSKRTFVSQPSSRYGGGRSGGSAWSGGSGFSGGGFSGGGFGGGGGGSW